VETLSEIPVVRVQALDAEPTDADPVGVLVSRWSQVEVPRGRRPSPTTIAVVAALAGISAMALGAAAVLTAGDSRSAAAVSASADPSAASGVEPRVLALVAKPSTQRIVFSRSGGRLVLAVGSGGRAAILVGGLEQAAPGKPYVAWVLRSGSRPVAAARFVGTERAVFLSRRIRRNTSVVISAKRPVGGAAERDSVATLG
jgi:hypothetical protein